MMDLDAFKAFNDALGLARKVIRRGTTRGRKTESEKDRWLLAKMAPPVSGMCS